MKKSLLLAFYVLIISTLTAQSIVDSSIKIQELKVGNLLHWTIDVEESANLFLIEKSTDGNSFEHIGTVEASNDSDDAYRFIDTRLGESNSYYRLKIVDEDGTSSYSQATMVKRSNPNQFSVVTYAPTLVDKTFELSIDALKEGQLEYELVSYQGELILSEIKLLYPGLNELQLDLTDVIEGIYKVNLRVDNEEETLVIQKASDELVKKLNMASSLPIDKN